MRLILEGLRTPERADVSYALMIRVSNKSIIHNHIPLAEIDGVHFNQLHQLATFYFRG